jgi:predicted phosphoribosyltransferase
VLTPDDLYAIGAWYDAFPQLADGEVQTILAEAAAEYAARMNTGMVLKGLQ